MTPDHLAALALLIGLILALLVVNRFWLVWTGRDR